MADRRKKREPVAPPEPANLSAYHVDAAGEELVIFTWEASARPARLSPAERAVLDLVLQGRSNAEIARARGTSTRTIANQVASLLRKLGAGSRFELMGRATTRD